MAVTIDEVRHIATLARLGLDDARARAVAVELNSILDHMAVLAGVDTSTVAESDSGGAPHPLRPDSGPPARLGREISAFAPRTRAGFVLVPRLSTHDDPEPAP